MGKSHAPTSASEYLFYEPQVHFIIFSSYFQDQFFNKSEDISPDPRQFKVLGGLPTVLRQLVQRRPPRRPRRPTAGVEPVPLQACGAPRWEASGKELQSGEEELVAVEGWPGGQSTPNTLPESKGNWTGGDLLESCRGNHFLLNPGGSTPTVPAFGHRQTCASPSSCSRGRSQRYAPCKDLTGQVQAYWCVPVVFAHFHPKLQPQAAFPNLGLIEGAVCGSAWPPEGLFPTHGPHLCTLVGKLQISR